MKLEAESYLRSPYPHCAMPSLPFAMRRADENWCLDHLPHRPWRPLLSPLNGPCLHILTIPQLQTLGSTIHRLCILGSVIHLSNTLASALHHLPESDMTVLGVKSARDTITPWKRAGRFMANQPTGNLHVTDDQATLQQILKWWNHNSSARNKSTCFKNCLASPFQFLIHLLLGLAVLHIKIILPLRYYHNMLYPPLG